MEKIQYSSTPKLHYSGFYSAMDLLSRARAPGLIHYEHQRQSTINSEPWQIRQLAFLGTITRP